MTELLIKSALLFANATVLGALLVMFTKRRTTTAKSQDNNRRWAPAKSTLGGTLFAVTLFTGELLFQCLDLWSNLALLSAFAIGLIDDLRRISPLQKLCGQWIAAICILVGTYLSGEPIWCVIVFALGAVVMMNSINMLDNMDGAATIGSLPFWMLNALLFCTGQINQPLGMFMLIAAIVFLIFNAYPSKLFMGDSGSMLLGIAAVVCMWEVFSSFAAEWYMLLPLWAFVSALTLADTALVVFRRLQHGKSPMQGGKDHSTHHLVYMGWSQSKVNYVFLAMSLFQGLSAFFYIALGAGFWMVLIAMLFYPIVWFIILWNISGYNLKSGKFDYSSH